MRGQRVNVGKVSSPGLALAFFAYLAFAVLMTYPLFFRMKDHTLIFPVDSLPRVTGKVHNSLNLKGF